MGGEAVTIEGGKDEDTGREESICNSGEDIGIEGTGGRVGDTDEDKGREGRVCDNGEDREGTEGTEETVMKIEEE